MRVEVKNEYDMLKSVILGRPEGANWPTGDHYFDKMISCSTYEEPLQRGKIDDTIVQIARMNMLYMKDKLEDIGIKVYRPEIKDYAVTYKFGTPCT